MKKVHLFLIKALIISCLMIIIAGCKGDTPNLDEKISGETNSNTSGTSNIPEDDSDDFEDPVATITVNISESISIDISSGGYIRWTAPDNFYLYTYPYPYLVSICDFGEVNGLGYIIEIPKAGFTTPMATNSAVACETGHGYVMKFENKNSSSTAPQYIRLYVVESLINTAGEIMGKKVQYEYPFDPTELTVSKDTLFFSKQGIPTQKVTVSTKDTDWTHSRNVSWINVNRDNDNTLSIWAETNNSQKRRGIITVETNESRKEIIVEQAAGLYAIGDHYSVNGVSGIVYKINDDGTAGMIVSMEETSCIWSIVYEITSCTDIFDGMKNMSAIKNITDWQTKYPAFKWCNDRNTGSISGWYLPAQTELNDLFVNIAQINAALINQGKDPIRPDNHWSSSEVNDNITWYQNFSTGDVLSNPPYNKKNAYKVRAVRAF